MTTAAPTVPDPYEAADKAEARNVHYLGSVAIDAYNAVLVKGVGKAVYDPQQHSPDQRVTALQIIITPLPRAGVDQYTIIRELIAESNEWTRTIKPSLDKLSTSLKAVHGKWAHVEMMPLGTYLNKAGETKQRTMPRFVAIFNTEQECQAAADTFYRRGDDSASSPTPQPQPAPASTDTVNSSVGRATAAIERATAARFLPALFNSAKPGDPAGIVDRFVNAIKANGLTAKHFDVNSPEVIAIITANTQN